MEELRRGVDEVGDLRDEQEEQGLAEVGVYGYDCEYHAGYVAVGVADEDAGWVGVLSEEREGDAEEGEEEVEGEEVRICGWVGVVGCWIAIGAEDWVEREWDEIEAGVEQEEERDD